MQKVNVGIIGLGNMGLLHLMNCLHMDDVKVLSVADKSKRSLKKAESLGVENTHEDFRDLIDKESSKLDAVVISLPNFLHFDSIKLSLEAGLDIFIEKPLAPSLEECQNIVSLVEKSGRKLMPGHSMRSLGAIIKMKEATDKGQLGSLELLTIESLQNGPLSHGVVPKPISDWWFDPKKSGGGALLDLGYHLVDLYRFFAGESKVHFSHLDYKYNLSVEDGATIILNSNDSSTRGVINVGWFEKAVFPRLDFRLILHGNADYMSTDDLVPKNMYYHAFKEGTKNFLRKIIGKKIHPLSYTYYYEPYYKEMRHFLNCIMNDSDPLITPVDGLKTMEIICEAYDLFRKKDSFRVT